MLPSKHGGGAGRSRAGARSATGDSLGQVPAPAAVLGCEVGQDPCAGAIFLSPLLQESIGLRNGSGDRCGLGQRSGDHHSH